MILPMRPSSGEFWTLLSRSHTAMLLEDYIKTHDVAAPRKVDITILSQAQEEFEHLCEVFEQDLRLGEKEDVAEWCKTKGYESVLKSALWLLLKKKHDDPSSLVAVKALVITEEERKLAEEWRLE